MRTSTLLTTALLGLLLWASCTRAEEETPKEAPKETTEETSKELEDDEVEEEKPKKNKTTEIEEESDVMVLHINNFERALSENKYLLVEFYAPWCGHCQRLAPVYEEVAGRLKQEEKDMRLAKVNAIEEKELTEEFEVGGYPTIKLFKKNLQSKPYETITITQFHIILNWHNKILANIKNKTKIGCVCFCQDMESEPAKVLDELYFSTDVEFAKTSSPEVFNKYEVTADSVVLFKKFDEGRVDFPLTEEGKLDKQNLTSFIQENSLELIIHFTPEVNTHDHLSHTVLCPIAMKSSSLASLTRLMPSLFQILYVVLDVNDESQAKILEYFGVTIRDIPTVRILFMMTSSKTCTLSLWYAQPFYMSEEIPEDWDKGHVKVLVGKNFKSVALDPTKNVFVEFYAPWCHFCKELAPIWDQLGEKYANHTNIIIAKMDATANEAEGVDIGGFPTLVYYPAEGKEVQYHGDKTLEKMSEFLDNGGVMPEEPEESDEDEDDDEEVSDEKAAEETKVCMIYRIHIMRN
uniref:protein disulfide-isomerase n=1 Tax=Periophthalmus magnuspinnatus TaxID=409849 RepID=A0A3B4AT17_9GOBI